MTGIPVVCLKLSQRHQVWCLIIGRVLCAIGVDKKAILLGVAHNEGGNPHVKKTSFPWGGRPAPKGNIKGKYLYFIKPGERQPQASARLVS